MSSYQYELLQVDQPDPINLAEEEVPMVEEELEEEASKVEEAAGKK